MKLASSGRARGSTPGSLKLVLSSMAMTKTKSNTANTGMAGDRCTARYGHLYGTREQTGLQKRQGKHEMNSTEVTYAYKLKEEYITISLNVSLFVL